MISQIPTHLASTTTTIKPVSLSDEIASQTPYLRKVAVGFTKDHYLAQDLVQDTLLVAINKQKQFIGPLHMLRPWLYRLMHNTFVNQYRRAQRFITVDIFEDSANEFWDMLGESKNEGELVFDQDFILNAIEALPVKQREIMRLRVSGYKYEEIAQVKGIPIGTVRNTLFRCRQQLTDYFSNPGQEVLAGHLSYHSDCNAA